MKKIYTKLSLLVLAATLHQNANSQCATQTPLGTSTNMFTLIRNGNHPIAVDKDLNMVVFIHRNDAAAYGGSSGHLRYDMSTNAGATWSLNLGVLNPAMTFPARYPNTAIYNPTNNVNPANTYISYMAPQLNGALWNGVVTGVQMFNGTGTTETYNQNGIGLDQIPHSMITSAPGIFWAIDPIGTIATGYKIYKGVWNTGTSDIVWNLNYSVNPPFSTGWNSAPQVVDYNIGFDPTGQIGYFSFQGNVTPGPGNTAVYPILYKTTNGGTSWTGPIVADVSKLSCISSNTVSPNMPSTNTEHDLIVDVYGNPHIITTVGNANNNYFDYNNWHHMYDLTMRNGVWVAHDLGNVNGGMYTAGISPNFATHYQAPQAARTDDGTKVFFTWTDNSTYSLGQANSTPDLYGKAYDVVTNMWTQTKNFTSCNTSLAGKIFYPHAAPEVLQPTTSTYKIAEVYGENNVPNDLGQQANFKFLDNLTFANSEFSLAVQSATVTIAQGSNLIFCPGGTVNVSVNNASEVFWSNGSSSNPMPITTGSITSYTVAAQIGCLVGTTTLSVQNLVVNANAVTQAVCPGNPATFTASGNALNYVWTPGPVTGSNVVLNPVSNQVTVTAMGSASCTTSSTVAVNLLPAPSISIAGSTVACAGHPLSLTASGGNTYMWTNNATGNTYTGTASTPITVIGTAANTCTGTATFTMLINPSPTVTAVTSQTAVCMGQTLALSGSGATTYSWNNVSSGPNTIVTPSSSQSYTLTGANSFGCTNSAVLPIAVLPLPSLTVTPSKSFVCQKEKITLVASGANNYTWPVQGSLTNSISFTPANAQTYTFEVIMTNTTGCSKTEIYSLVVNVCAGIEQFNSNNIQVMVYPNPNNGSFSVKTAINIDLNITNELGQVIRNISLNEGNNHEISISDLAHGIYFISGSNDQGSVSQKIIINK